MDLEEMQVRRTGRLGFTVTQADESSVSATFIMQSDTDTVQVTEDYVDGVASFSIESPGTDVVGTYEYQINENFATGSPDIYPSGDDCDGDCDLPTVEICESLPTETS